MRTKRLYRYSVPFALSLLVTACGGGSGGQPAAVTDNNNAPAESNVDLGAANTIAPSISVTGRVADGYIRGATVCVDINENDACDTDEPFAISTEGGSYDLAVPEEHSDKPIVAAIPAEAIDEDTGEAVGQPMVFIAPADRPEFLSPITTLVHQEKRANPALNSDEAELAVKNMLGIEEVDVSLFTDYVAQSDATRNTNGTAERFEYLHNTARVVASMMKDIETQVENAAVSRGVDVAGNEDTRRAIQDIVRNEVRELLPQIARQVAEIVTNSEAVSASSADTESSVFDAHTLAVSLRPEVAADTLTSRIEANMNRVENVETDLRSMLSDGAYWMEFDCQYDWYNEEEEVSVSSDADSDQLDLSMIRMPECEAMYGRVELSDDESELVSRQYVLNTDSATWEPIEHDEDDLRYADYSLVDGNWILLQSAGPAGDIEFLSDNSAVVSSAEGTMQLKSVTQVLDGSPVIHHLLNDDADAMWFDLISRNDIFPTESKAHRVSVRQTSHPYVMFNHPDYSDDDNRCAEYNNNCNVVEIVKEGDTYVALSIDQLRESVLEGVSVRPYSRFDGQALMHLTGLAQEDGQLPNQGRVEWIMEGEVYPIDFPSVVDGGDGAGEMPVDIRPEPMPEAFPEPMPESTPEQAVEPIPESTPEQAVEPLPESTLAQTVESMPELTPELMPEPWEFSNLEECLVFFTEETEQGVADSNPPIDFFAPGEFAGTREELALLVGEDVQPTVENIDVAVSNEPDDGPFEVLENQESVDELCSQIMSETVLVEGVQNDDPIVSGTISTEPEVAEISPLSLAMFNGRWKLIEVDGVEMIEIHLPIQFRNNSDEDSEEALLLIENDGFVRAGARLPDTRIDRVFTYNENAFVTLRSIVENGMGNNQ